jgi:UDP-N-acetyl-2-amino-2-deoxyglucuronate dehydrogenase
VHLNQPKKMAGHIELQRASVRWYLSTDARDLPFTPQPGKRTTFRSITVDGQEVEFTDGFADLHTRVYEQVLAGHGFGIEDARRSIELAHDIRHAPVTMPAAAPHRLLACQ